MPSLADMRTKAKEAGLMKLDKLIAKRQSVPTNEFPIPVKELCERFEKLYTGCVNDVMREACLLDQNLPHEIMPLRDEMVVCGEAFTVKSAPNCMIEGEMTFRAQMLDDFKPNGVVVWDTSDDVEASLWGGVMTATAITKGIRGAVIAGGIRDTKQILEQKFPVFYIHAAGMTRLELLVRIEGDRAIFTVLDDGCGIRADRLGDLFTGYLGSSDRQGDADRRNMGIGLSVCATIIKAHGGHIRAQNRDEGGAEFTFTLNMEE